MKGNLEVLAVLAAALAWASPVGASDRYQVEDAGGFGATGRFIEFVDRYGWESYKVDFDFGLDQASRRLTTGSSLRLTIRRKDGYKWSYRCRVDDYMEDTSGRREMWANINMLYGSGVSVLTECRIPPQKFAKAVGLDYDMVGQPTVVFHVMIKDGQARPGLQKGLYVLPAGEMENGLSQYANPQGDPSELAVLFASAPAARPPLTQMRGVLPNPIR